MRSLLISSPCSWKLSHEEFANLFLSQGKLSHEEFANLFLSQLEVVA